MATLTWIGDSDPDAQTITLDGVTFVRGEKTEVKDKDAFQRLSGNPMFSSDGKYDSPTVIEPSDDEMEARADDGTEKGALKRQLRGMGEDVKGNPSVETLRARLASKLNN